MLACLFAATVASAIGDCERIFDSEIRDGLIHGAAVVAGGLDGEALSGAWGWADAAHTVPMTTRTVVDVASVTKAAAGITAYLVAHAHGLVDFDAPFTNYLASYKASLVRNVTIRDLANHVSGFGEADGSPRAYFNCDAKKMLNSVLSMSPYEPTFGRVAYSCRNYVLLGQAFESLTDRRVNEFCRREIFIPAGMVDTSLGAPLPAVGMERLAQTMGTDSPGVISDEVARSLFAAGIGTFNAGMFSTAEDLARLMRTYLRGGVCDNGTRLWGADEMVQITPSLTNQIDGARTFGWQYASDDLPNELRGSSLFHSGWSGQTVLLDLKRRRYAVVLTTRCGEYNRAKKDRFEAISSLIKDAALHRLPAPKDANTLTDDEEAAGWRLAWDGKTFDGWVVMKSGLAAPPEKGWVIEDGTLSMRPVNGISPEGKWFPLPPDEQKLGGGGDIVTVNKYRNFAFKFDFRLTRKGNSGIKYFYDENQNNGTCEEYQILDGGHPDWSKGKDGNRRIASLYDIFPANAESLAKPVGEWNQGMIVANGPRVEHWLNEKKVLEYDRTSKAFKDGVMASKYAAWGKSTDGKPQPWGEIVEGRILLQDHGDSTIYFCNLKIKELN